MRIETNGNSHHSLVFDLLADMVLSFNAKQFLRLAPPEIYKEILDLMDLEDEELTAQELLVEWLVASNGRQCA